MSLRENNSNRCPVRYLTILKFSFFITLVTSHNISLLHRWEQFAIMELSFNLRTWMKNFCFNIWLLFSAWVHLSGWAYLLPCAPSTANRSRVCWWRLSATILHDTWLSVRRYCPLRAQQSTFWYNCSLIIVTNRGSYLYIILFTSNLRCATTSTVSRGHGSLLLERGAN